MPFFQPKIRVIEAIQYTGTNVLECLNFTGKYHRFHEWFHTDEDYVKHVAEHNNIFKVFIPGGDLRFHPTDWVVRGARGNIYRLTNEEFHTQFEAMYTEDEKFD